MNNVTEIVDFNNAQNPGSAFDLLLLNELYARDISDHNPELPHEVDFFVILLVTSGMGYHTIDFTKYKLEPGTIITIRKGQIHQFFRSTNAEGYLLLFKHDFMVSFFEARTSMRSLQLFNELLGSPKIQLDKNQLDEVLSIFQRVEKEYFRVMDAYSLGIIRSELHILISILFRIKSNMNTTFSRRYLNEFITFQDLVEKNIQTLTKVSDYAAMMHVSTKSLNNYTRSIVNKSAKAFIDEMSIIQIKRMLLNTDLSVKEIAYESGYTETTNFFKFFKRHVGVTPEKYRSMNL